jgi:predicted DNA-binding transcriptional regulator YafY
MDIETKRISRITAILIQLQSRQLVKAPALADKFGVSVRTIYRDIKTLENAGVPIVIEEGKGYSLVDGYRIPPVMFTETEANALLTAELIIQSSKDTSLISEFTAAIAKIRAVIPRSVRNKTEKLEQKIVITNTYIDNSPKSKYLLEIQRALVDHWVLNIEYTSKEGAKTQRSLEPFALYSNQNNEWVLVAFCRLRQDFRSFSLATINKLLTTTEHFEPQKMTFVQYRQMTYEKEKIRCP